MHQTFKAPDGWEDYASIVEHKTRLLISLGIWEDITELQLNLWMQNFSSSKEAQYLAACILDTFTFRTRKMCQSMMRNILMDIVPNHCRELGINNFNSIENWKANLVEGDPLVRFIPVEVNDGRFKSSSVIARQFIESNSLKDRFIKKTTKDFDEYLTKGTKLFVFLDDFSGTGQQFINCVNEMNIPKYQNKANFLYIPLAAHVKAISNIHKRFDFIKVKPVDTLDKKDEFFFECENGFFRGDKTNTIESAKNFYKELFTICNNSNNLFGFGSEPLSLTYSFFMSTPNNNIKALYHNEEGAWNRLTFRSEK